MFGEWREWLGKGIEEGGLLNDEMLYRENCGGRIGVVEGGRMEGRCGEGR